MVVFHCGALVHIGNALSALSPECNNSHHSYKSS